jgi:hypothetical protein
MHVSESSPDERARHFVELRGRLSDSVANTSFLPVSMKMRRPTFPFGVSLSAVEEDEVMKDR